MKKRIKSCEDLYVYQLAEDLGDRVWDTLIFPRILWGLNAYIRSIGREEIPMTND